MIPIRALIGSSASVLLLVSGFVFAQAPGAATPPEVSPSQFKRVTVGGPRAEAEAYVKSRGWKLGWDLESGRGVWVGEAPLMAPDANGLALAMFDAQLDVKFQFAEHIAGVTEAYALRESDRNPDARRAEIARLDKLVARPGGDPVAEAIRDLLESMPADADAGISFRTRLSTASKTAAQAAIPGMVTVATFVQTDETMLKGQAAVVMVSTPRSRQMADAMLGRGGPVDGKFGVATEQYVESLSEEALVYSCGSTYRTNERGELILIGFGVGAVEGTEFEDQRDATETARQAATEDLRRVAGELVEGARLLSRFAEKTRWVDGRMQSESRSSVSQRIGTVARGLKMPGVEDVSVRVVEHPVLGRVVCVVRSWNLSKAQNAAELREIFAKQAGWQGGDGVQPDRSGSGGGNVPPPQPGRGVPSGKGGGGLEDE